MLSSRVKQIDFVPLEEEKEERKEKKSDVVMLELSPEPDIVFSNVALDDHDKTTIINKEIEKALYYLKGFDQDKLKQLEEKYRRSPEELEALLKEYRNSYRYYEIKHYLSILLNLFYLAFQIEMNSKGFKVFINTFKPNTEIPDGVANGIGISAAVLDFLFYSFIFSPPQQAVLSTLEYALQDPIQKRMKDLWQTARNEPKHALLDASKFFFNQSVLLTANLTGAMTEIVDNAELFNQFPPSVRWMPISSLLYFGNYYLKKFMNADYYDGLHFWFNNKKNPWLVGEIKRGNVAVPLQIFLQGMISTVGLRSYPFYYYLATASKETLGWWISPPLVAMLVAWHSLCVLYPATFLHYMNNKEKVDTALREKINWELVDKMVHEAISELHFDHLTEDELSKWKERIVKEYIKLQRNLIEAKIVDEKGNIYLLKEEPHNIIPLLYRGAIGGYLGYQYLTPLLTLLINAPTFMSIGAVMLGASLFAGLLYKAEQNRVMDKLVLEHIQKDQLKSEIKDSVATSGLSTLLTIVSYVLSIGNGISNTMGTISTGVKTFGTNPAVLGATMVVAGENMLNNIYYSTKKIYDSTKNLVASYSGCLGKTPGTLFCRSKQTSSANQKKEENNLLSHQVKIGMI